MLKSISSTTLKQRTKSVLDQVSKTAEPVVISTYKEPKVIIFRYEPELAKSSRPSIEELKKFMTKTAKKTDTTSHFRALRDGK